jgi:glycosyltransferase involved in cell wall biosynthesis
LVLPSLLETFGLVYPEAMSQGLPVIYTRGQGFDGHYPDGHVGYAINPNDPRDIAEKIKVIFSDYLRFSTNAFNASLDFSWDKIVDKLLEVYSKH